MNEEALKKLDRLILDLSHSKKGNHDAKVYSENVLIPLHEIKALLTKEKTYINTPTECPTCARGSKRFELTNYPAKYMCDGCALTRGSIAGKWDLLLFKQVHCIGEIDPDCKKCGGTGRYSIGVAHQGVLVREIRICECLNGK